MIKTVLIRSLWLISLVFLLSASNTAELAALELTAPYPINEANRRTYTPHVQRAAQKHKLDPALLHAIISAESGYNPQAVSPKGALGLMQILPETARDLGLSDPLEPLANIDAGAKHIKRLLKLYPNIQLALAAYNAGEGAVARNRRTIPPYPETQRFVVRVLNFYLLYRQRGLGVEF